ncbi:MAG: Rv3654c family TadE-like protein [Dietzia sp.]
MVDDDDGFMTVSTAFAVAAVLALTVAVLLVGRAAVAAHSARSAADLSALAGAHALRAGEDPCAVASGIAGANRATLASCRVDGLDVVTRAAVSIDLGVLGARSASAVARAGPV